MRGLHSKGKADFKAKIQKINGELKKLNSNLKNENNDLKKQLSEANQYH